MSMITKVKYVLEVLKKSKQLSHIREIYDRKGLTLAQITLALEKYLKGD